MRINEDFIDRISDDDMTQDVNPDESPKGVHPELYDRMLLLTSNSPITKTMLSHLCHRYEVLTNSDDYIAEEAYDPAYGARPVKRFIQSHIETEIAGLIIKGDVTDGCTIKIGADESGLTFEVK